MATNVKQMMEAANAAVPRITPAQAREMMAEGNTLVVDVRDGPEVEKSGKVAGAVHVSRGMLEFRADPESPLPRQEFRQEQDAHRLLRVRRTLGAERQGAQGHGLRPGL
jgi:rhodanese-related sulfurtransferase